MRIPLVEEAWRITWSQLCRGKEYRINTESRLTILVFWPLFLIVFLGATIFVIVKRMFLPT